MTKGNGRMKKIVTLVFVLLTLLTAAASAESYTQADFEWAEAVQDQSTLTLKEQAKYLDIVKQRQRGIALLAMGGADTPFQIASAAQLAELAQYVNAGDATFVSAHYVLTDDVNLSAYGNWTPIGTEDHPFEGVFDGQNHVVTGLKIDRSQGVCQGLFGYVSGTDDAHKAQIKNVAVRDAQIRARTEVGAVVGRYGRFTAGYVEPLENCAMIGGTIQGTSSMGQSSCVGGIVGRACGEIQRCYATGNIIGADNAIEYGGIVGETYKAVKACYWTGRLSALGSYADDFGGIAGSARGAVTNCYTTGDITGSLDNAATLGSIVGCALDRVTNCYATGSVKGWRAIGGIAGQAYGDTYAHATISGCMALNTSVESNPFYSIGRVAGLTGQESVLNDNYAWDGMRVNGQKIPEGQQSVENGTDLTYDDTNGLSRQFETIFGGNSAWTYAENGLPTLKNVGGTQSSELPSWMLGSETTIYITTAQQLKRLADEVNAGDSKSDKTYLLANDIDLSAYANWTPIGTFTPNSPQANCPFSGVFDGQGYSITGLKMSGNEDSKGLFGYTYSGAIRNVVIRNPEIEGKDQVGALVGYQAYSNQGIKNCAVIGGKIQGRSHVGGLVGYMEESPIQNCYSTCEVVAMDFYAGGIVGDHRVVASIRNCYATGNISGTYSGGIVGVAQDVERCVALGQTVTGKSSNRVTDSVRISDVYAWGGMKVNGNTVTYGAANNENGADLVCNGGALSTQFSEIFANDDAWTYTENGLPILKVVKGEQSSELPSWMLSDASTIYITTAQQLKQLADEVNAGDSKSGKTYLLANDIDLSVYPNWSPIGTYVYATSTDLLFSGVFDGQGYTIRNLTCTSDANGFAGLFGNFNGTVQNLILRDAQITSELNAGAVVSENYGGRVLNCAMIGGSVKGNKLVGGIAGLNDGGIIENCYATGDVTYVDHTATNNEAGGVVGSNHSGTVQNCYALGSVKAKDSCAGGVVGSNYDGGTIQNCAALGQSTSVMMEAHRVVGTNISGTLGSNYAWSGVQVNGQPVTDGLADNENGEDILVHDSLIYGKNAQIFAWPGFDTAVWELRNDQPGKLPRIRGTNADPTLSLSAQSIMVTCDVELNGDAGVSGFRYKVNDAANDTEYSGVFTVNLLDKLEIEPTIRTGYAFAQWSDGKTDNPYTMAVPGDVSLTAQTQIETYTIDYELNGGALEAGKTNPATYTLETAAFRLEEPTRTGYTFAGWTGSNGTTPQTDVGIAQGSTGNLYFEANWTANGYKILYTGVEGADVSTFPTKHVFGKDTAIPNPTKTDYSFAGWKVNGSAAARDLTLSGTAYTADITLEATWTKLTEPTPSVIMEGGTAFIVGKATEDAIMHIGKGVANFGVANLDYVDVDGKRLDPQFYTAKDGSILITVHQAYLNTLSVGEHILTAHLKGPGYEGQTVSGKIVVAPVPDMSNLPQTGDASPVLLWGATLGLCAAVLAVMKRKKK